MRIGDFIYRFDFSDFLSFQICRAAVKGSRVVAIAVRTNLVSRLWWFGRFWALVVGVTRGTGRAFGASMAIFSNVTKFLAIETACGSGDKQSGRMFLIANADLCWWVCGVC